MLLDRIENCEIFRPKMDSTKEVLHAIATFTADISPSFPYVNAELGGWDYDQTNQVLLLKLSDGKWITLHPQKIAIRGARDREETKALLAWIQAKINDLYARREAITPRYVSQAGLKVIEILSSPHDQLQNVRLCHLHGLCRGPQGRRDSPGGLSSVMGREVPGKASKSFRPTWKASAGGPWTLNRSREIYVHQ